MRLPVAAGLGVALLLAARLSAAAPHALPALTLDADVHAQLALSTCFWEPAPGGSFALRVEARNDGDRAREWLLAFRGTGDYGNNQTYASTEAVRVGPHEARTFDFTVPLRPWRSGNGISSQLLLSVQGPGISSSDSSLFMTRHYPHYSGAIKTQSPWVAMSESVGAAYWEPVKAELAARR